MTRPASTSPARWSTDSATTREAPTLPPSPCGSCWITPADCRTFFSQPPILEAVQYSGGRRRFTPSDLVGLAAAGELPTSSPGTARAYTDTGFLLAGLIIEALTGRPLQEAYRALVLDPAGMADTWLESSDEPPAAAPSPRMTLRGRTSPGWIRRSTGPAVGWSAPPQIWPRFCGRSPGASW